jgi:hypothetical protein
VRSRLYFHEDQHNDLILEGRKANYSAKLKPIKLEWRRGVFEPVEAPAPRDYSEHQPYG